MQLLLLLINFFYGQLVFCSMLLNYFFIKKEPIIVKILLTSLFTIDITILYLIIIYKINYGIFHYYYLFSFGIGFYFAYFFKKKCKKIDNLWKRD